ncbi:RsmB/NOP family class I SAM-dependent RNA methyltransferase [Allosphingosinicella deserti]|uniref:SAM-dependent methyltransferase n=1 Tax=Allosphingosinicella deserti TaxID=2116704 RepID=A0A2P7QUG9_9SPHN|nr:RsmB/NOP family class I SAM-dependent RNA methyltransferase [Sphingomonas deserti]PSJ41606.1 SAM-dependent methyltransferase [Sphingomonas deserti]
MNRNQDEVAGLPARRAALRLLDAVLRKGLPLEAALDVAARDLERADDRGFAHAIAAETLRRLTDLDGLIDSATKRPLPDDAKARFALRIALVQALALDTPPHAAIATVLPLVDGGPRKLVHGVFGTLMRSGATLASPPSLPPPVAARWERHWGADVVVEAEKLLAAPPPLDLIFRRGAELPADLEGTSLLPGHLRLPGRTAVVGLTGYGEGGWWVQDVAASLPARLLGAGEGRTALDLCAAPGGKTMQLASAGFAVTAVDSSESRLTRLSENLARTHLDAKIVVADLLKWSPPEKADAILLDAPCSATGIYRRHPDVLYRVRPKAIAELAEVQAKMLERIAGWLKPGGLLVYSVCSLEPEEGEQVVDSFLQGRRDYEAAHLTAGELPASVPVEGNRIRILPGQFGDAGGADGFFVARFRRTAAD